MTVAPERTTAQNAGSSRPRKHRRARIIARCAVYGPVLLCIIILNRVASERSKPNSATTAATPQDPVTAAAYARIRGQGAVAGSSGTPESRRAHIIGSCAVYGPMLLFAALLLISTFRYAISCDQTAARVHARQDAVRASYHPTDFTIQATAPTADGVQLIGHMPAHATQTVVLHAGCIGDQTFAPGKTVSLYRSTDYPAAALVVVRTDKCEGIHGEYLPHGTDSGVTVSVPKPFASIWFLLLAIYVLYGAVLLADSPAPKRQEPTRASE